MLSSKTTKQKALLTLAWVCFFWGTTWLASKVAVNEGVPGLQVAAIRQFLAGILYIIFFIVKKQPWPKGKQWGVIIILAVLNFMLSNGLSYWGLQFISSGLASIIGAIFPLWIVLINLFEGDRMPSKALTGLVLGFSGVCIIFYDHLKDFLNANFTLGIILSVLATMSWAAGSLYTKKHAANFNPYFSLGLQMLISGIALSGIIKTTGQYVPMAQISANTWWAILYLIIIGSILTFIAYLYSLQHLPTSLTSLYAYINPVVAVLLGVVIFSEKLNMFVAVGGAVTITGVYLVNDAFKKIAKTFD
jgi:drug/metabolite transporter (DMT)-like permease